MANATVYKKKKTSLFKSDGWKRFRKNKLAVIGLCVILLMVLAAVFAPVLVQNDPYMILETPEGHEGYVPFRQRHHPGHGQRGTG